jgi:hypothetical protein
VDGDEEFARALVAQELPGGEDALPLLLDRQRQLEETREVVATLGQQGHSSSAPATSLAALAVFVLPQVLAAATVFAFYWEPSKSVAQSCSTTALLKWRVWSMVSALRQLLHLVVVVCIVLGRSWSWESRRIGRLQILRNGLDGIGVFWFCIGNLWLLGATETKVCHHHRDPGYMLGVALLGIQYLQLCLPCVAAMILVPVVCCCFPILLPALRRMGVGGAAPDKGASTAINALPLKQFSAIKESNDDADPTCPVCLGDFTASESLRVLECSHHFHPACLDEWLVRNNSCPTCRRAAVAPNESRVELVQNDTGREVSFV